jgi:hypothetical protein
MGPMKNLCCPLDRFEIGITYFSKTSIVGQIAIKVLVAVDQLSRFCSLAGG